MSTVKGFNTTLGVLKYDAESLDNYNTPLFDSTSTYEVGDYVIKDGKLYRCITDVSTAGNWSSVSSNFVIAILTDDIKGIKEDVDDLSTDFSTLEGNVGTLGDNVQTLSNSVGTLSTDVNNLTTSVGKINNSIALPFSTSTSYVIGDYVLYGGSLYRFTDAHTAGAWTGTDAIQVQLAEQLTEEGVFIPGEGTNSVVQKNESNPNTASGEGAIAMGKGVIASGNYSFAFGCALDDPDSITPCTASGEGAIALGFSAVANNKEAVALGHRTMASGTRATAINTSTTASGDASFAAGNFSVASGLCSSAIGQVATAQSVASVALGDRVVSTGRACTVVGSMNVLDESAIDTSHGDGARKYLFIVGNGISNSARSNALAVDWDGNEELAGNLTLNKGATNEFTINGDIIKASIPHDTASGAIASFPDGAAMPVIDCSVAVAPNQNLHGYDNPWPAGGGVNKLIECVPGTYTSTNCQAVVAADGTITLSGTIGSTSEEIIIPLKAKITTPSEQFYLHLFNTVNANVAPSFELSTNVGGTTIDAACSPANRIYTVPTNRLGVEIDRVRFWMGANKDVAVTLHPMFALTNSVVPWTPYSNICPISGWTECKVTRTGANLFNKDTITDNAYVNGQGQVSTGFTEFFCSDYIPVKPETAYYIFTDVNRRIDTIRFFNANKVAIGGSAYQKRVVTTPANCHFVRINAIKANISADEVFFNYPSTDTAYHAYQGTTYTIDLNGTRYGGTLDVTTGKLTVDRAMVDLGTLGWATNSSPDRHIFRSDALTPIPYIGDSTQLPHAICSSYFPMAYSPISATDDGAFSIGGGLRVIVIDHRFSDVASFVSAVNGVQLCYELATPIEVDLTQTEITTLLGTNNIFADCGDTTVDYYADTTLFVNKKIAAAVAALS